jgi:transposase
MNQGDFKKLQEAYTLRGVELHQLHERVASLEEEVTRLKELLRLQQKRLFGKTSEASSGLNPPASNGTQPTGPPPEQKSTVVASHVRHIPPRGNRQLEISKLPKYTVIHDLPDAEKKCACCGGALHEIGRETSGQLEVIPVQYCVIEHIRLKYGCRPCESIVMAPKPPAPLPKALAGASLLTDVALNKYQYHLPLYRQSKIMKSYGITLSDKTLANWILSSGDALLKVYEAIWVILKHRYLQVDETPVKVLETNKKGYVWAYFAPNVGNKGLVAFEFSLTRQGAVATERLKTFNGLLQTDAYKGYNALRERDGIVGFGCFSHVRRKFSEVVKISGDTHGIAAEMIERMKPLYALEARMRDAGIDHRTRKRLRQKIARPLLKDIHKWLRSIKHKVVPKSKLGKAISYTLDQWPYLVAYLRHGMAEIDTNYVENKIRDIALGKKNWLFIGNEDCGKIHALWYTLIISAIINNLNPRVYIHYLLTKVHQLRRGEIDPIALLPDRIDIKELENFAAEQIEFGKKMLAAFNTS